MKKKEILKVFERGDYMSLPLKERRAVVREVSKRYKKARKNKKDDNCFIEQKNYSVVRRAVGYLRYDTEE